VQEYVYNFLVWWYAIKLKDLVIKLRKFEYTLLSATNTLDMLKNIGKPLYQDYTFVGRAIGFSIRSVWVVVGFTVFLVALIPIIIIVAAFALLPLLVIIQIALGLFFAVSGVSL
jgi:hypothetical protein